MEKEPEFLCGVVEGYYGRVWSHTTRLDYAGYLAAAGLNTFIYCPKSDAYLRKRWTEPRPAPSRAELVQLANTYRERGLYWGVGLSPYALYREYGPSQRSALRSKLREIAELGAPLMALLFDDMPGDVDDLAARQADIVNDICHWWPEVRLLVCPTYYSFDPVLEQYFGARPESYWDELGKALPAQVDIFWTGNQVCSQSISRADVERINQLLGRKVTLWDNYPVNDGAKRSRHLYLDPLPGREPELGGCLRGHLCNPMNQGLLSLPAFLGLGQLYGKPPPATGWCRRVLGEKTWKLLQRDGVFFRDQGLDAMDEAAREELAAEYEALEEPAGLEVAGWLRGEYTFDPACLTD